MSLGTNFENDYIGADATATFAYSFKILSVTDLRVIITDPRGGQTVLANGAHYTVTDVGLVSGSTVVLMPGMRWMSSGGFLDDNYLLHIERARPLARTADLRNQAYNPDDLEAALDELQMGIQRVASQVQRCIKLPEGLPASAYDLTLPYPEANKGFGWNASADELTAIGSSAVVPTTMDALDTIFLAGGTGASPRSIRAVLREVTRATDYAGEDAGAQMNAAIAAVTAGGVVDCRGFGAAENIHTEVLVSKACTLLFDKTTFTMTKRIYIQADKVRLLGGGINSTIFKAAATIAYNDNDLILASFGGTYPSPTTAINDVEIRDLTVDGNQGSASVGRPYPNDTHGTGINLNRMNRCKVHHCQVKNVVHQGIVLTGDDHEDCNNNEVAFNDVSACGEIHIGLENHTSGNNVHHNFVHDGLTLTEVAGGSIGVYVGCLGVGNVITDNEVEMNRIYTMPGLGIKVDEFADRTHVINNKIKACKGCIRVMYSMTAENKPNDILVSGNKCYGSTSTAIGAIDITGASGNQPVGIVVTDNQIVASQGGGISAQECSHIQIHNNHIRSVGLGAGEEQNGVAIYGSCVSPSVQGNVVTGASGAGVFVHAAGTTDALVLHNTLTGNSGGALTDNGTRTQKMNKTVTTDGYFRYGSPVVLPDGTMTDVPQLFLDANSQLLAIKGGLGASGAIYLAGLTFAGNLKAVTNNGGVGLAIQDDADARFTVSKTVDGATHTRLFDMNRDGAASFSSYLGLTESSAPGAAPEKGARLYVRDSGGGKTQLVVIFQSGEEQVIAAEP